MRGPQARRVAQLSEAGRLSLAVRELEKVHPGFAHVCEGGTSVAWDLDAWARGGFARWKPGQMTAWLPELARAEGRLHFAGEHTSLFSKTMEGALESGHRAAREINDAS